VGYVGWSFVSIQVLKLVGADDVDEELLTKYAVSKLLMRQSPADTMLTIGVCASCQRDAI
jgi:hypothetical protein